MNGMMEGVMEQAVLQIAQQMEDKVDADLHALDNLGEDELEVVRQNRVAEMRHMARKKEEWMRKGHGEVQALRTEKEFFAAMKGEERMVCHFYRDNWPCKVMEKHLKILSKQHLETKFCQIDAEKSPYLSEKLKIWMLPTLAIVKNEKTTDYIVGLDDMGGVDDFHTDALAIRLGQAGIINYKPGQSSEPTEKASGIRKGGCPVEKWEGDEDSDFD